VLKEFSTLLKNSIRQTDILGRWGGDEFLILVPFATKESIEIFSNNILKKISSHKFSYINKLSSSLGVTIIKKDDTEESFISRADKALYKAKKAGKNKVEILL
jgi:diguanylate cyclase (GGDEF)-like protein